MTEPPSDETVTRGGYELPPPSGAGRYAGPADDPDRYELIGEGRSGGEGTTWQARYHGDLPSPLPLAVKWLRVPPDTEAERRRWHDQAALLRHVRADHVVQVHEVFFGPSPHPAGKADVDATPGAYLVMEWVEGPTLRELCAAKPATRATVRRRMGYIGQAATALADLGSTDRSAGNPSLHRDLKPGNCIIHDQRGLVLIDVSTLRPLADGFDAAGWHTPQYTAPEVLADPRRPRTPAADVYSLGALAAFCLTGKDLAPAADSRTVLERAARGAGTAEPARLAAHIMTTLNPDPHRRPADPATWGRQLVELSRTRSPRTVSAVVVVVLAVVAGLILLAPWNPLHPSEKTASPPPPAGFAGDITSPPGEAEVKQCSYLEGTATVPDGWTLILAMRNLSNSDPRRFAEVVFGFDDPARLPSWRGAQYFGQENDTVGQRYQVELIAVPMPEAQSWQNGNGDDSGSTLADGGVVLDTVRVNRVEGLVENFCEGP